MSESRWSRSLFRRAVVRFLQPQRRVSERWERDWANPSYAPGWRVEDMPTEVQSALSDGWMPSASGKRLLDLGCGDGVVAVKLAGTGLDVVAVDVASPAIDIARERWGDTQTQGELTFEVADATKSLARFGTFDAVLDRGCFHNIVAKSRRDYAESLAAATVAGSPVLLICHTRDVSADERIAEVRDALAPEFEIEGTEVMRIADKVPGVTIRLRRSGS